jgi:hypothetical protein
LIIAHYEKIYKLKKEIKKCNLSINEFQNKTEFALKTLSELKDKSEEKFKGETTSSKRLRRI